ncbi:Mur ligase domain-containing protein [Kitasatospora griseola]|uniref:Mur ligase domain-containing protein n=1 Tax=Kitasatospora griseola TaxID=2064 RepID=UPI0034282319
MSSTPCPGTAVDAPRPSLPGLLTAPHLVDVAAPGMEAMALWLAGAGADVTGSVPKAHQDSPVVAALKAAGVQVHVGFGPAHVNTDRTAAVWSGAVAGPHPELDHAQALRLPILPRPVALRMISAQAYTVAVAGSHSTATAAAALAALLDDGDTGWILNAPAVGGVAGHAAGRRIVTDFCPDNTTHEAAPTAAWQRRPTPYFDHRELRLAAALVMSTSANAPHYEDNLEGLGAAERLARHADTIVLPMWDNTLANLHEHLTDRPDPNLNLVTVGFAPDSTVQIASFARVGAAYHAVMRHRQTDHPFILPVTGRHHALAVCAAVATALAIGEHPGRIAERAAAFRGVQRSLTVLGEEADVTVVDSRARHPREIMLDVQAALALTEHSVLVVLQPDGLARATMHAAAIGDAIADGDLALLLPVSTPLSHHTVPDPLDAIEQKARLLLGDGAVHRARTGPGEVGPEQQIGAMVTEGDLVLVVGTGPAERLGPRLLSHLASGDMPTPQLL